MLEVIALAIALIILVLGHPRESFIGNLRESFMGWLYGNHPNIYGGYQRRVYQGYRWGPPHSRTIDSGWSKYWGWEPTWRKWTGRYGNYGGRNGYAYYNPISTGGFARGAGGYEWTNDWISP